MRRLQLFEIEDLPGCPASIRDALTDYVQFVVDRIQLYAAAAPLLRRVLERTGTPAELRELTASLPDAGYTWEIGEAEEKIVPLPNMTAILE